MLANKLMTAFGCLLGCLLLLPTCASAASLRATDVSIYWPIKSNKAKDGIFKMEGSGKCNLPDLALAVQGVPSSLPALNRSQFEMLVKDVFGKGADGLCNSREDISFSGNTGSDTEFLKNPKSENLSLLRGVPSRACKYESWRIVGFRYDPCLNAPGKVFKEKKDIEKCIAEVRLVAQPFHLEEPSWFPDDIALHLIYKVNNRESMVKDLLELGKVTQQVEKKAGPWDSFDNKMYSLRPHPGLRAEMNTCGGPMIAATVAFLKKHTIDTALVEAAWMASSTTGMQWSFGFSKFKPDRLDVQSTSTFGRYDNFSAEIFNFEGGFPFNAGLQKIEKQSLMPFYSQQALMKSAPLTPEEVKNLEVMVPTIEKISNPHFFAQGDTTCFSCHMLEQTVAELANRKIEFKKTKDRYKDVEVWPPFAAQERSVFNFRNFGYGPGFSFGMTMRTLNEAHFSAYHLNLLYVNAMSSRPPPTAPVP